MSTQCHYPNHSNSLMPTISKLGHSRHTLAMVLLPVLLLLMVFASFSDIRVSDIKADHRAENALFQADIDSAAAIFELSPQQLESLLDTQGVQLTGEEKSLQQVVDDNQLSRKDLITLLLQ